MAQNESNPALELVTDVRRAALMLRMKRFYEALTGGECEAGIFCVSKTSLRGCYSVHRLGSCDFYEVNVWRDNGAE